MSLTSEDLNQISKIVASAVSGLATKGELQEVSSTLREVSSTLRQEISILRQDISTLRQDTVSGFKQMKQMINEDYEAEAERVTSIDRRLKKLRREFNDHVSNHPLHQA